MSSQPISTDASDPAPTSPRLYSRRRVINGLTTTLIGLLMFLIGTRPGLFGLDRSPLIGFVQIAVFLVGLGVVCIGGYISMMALWKCRKVSILAEIGVRLVATGYVIAVFTGMADVFGFGSHSPPLIPYFGQWQAFGVMIGEGIMALGFLLMIPYSKR